MTTSEPADDADTLASIIPFRPRRSTMAPHPAFGSPEPRLSVTADAPCARPYSAPIQLSFFENSPNS
jgi:hypothetical protein